MVGDLTGLDIMIVRFSDHAANERTFLAWVRTAIAIIAFGFLVEKFDLFMRMASASLATSGIGSQAVGNIAGLALIALGGGMMIFAALRFRKTALDIDVAEVRVGPRRATRYYPGNVAGAAGSRFACVSDLHGAQPSLT